MVVACTGLLTHDRCWSLNTFVRTIKFKGWQFEKLSWGSSPTCLSLKILVLPLPSVKALLALLVVPPLQFVVVQICITVKHCTIQVAVCAYHVNISKCANHFICQPTLVAPVEVAVGQAWHWNKLEQNATATCTRVLLSPLVLMPFCRLYVVAASMPTCTNAGSVPQYSRCWPTSVLLPSLVQGSQSWQPLKNVEAFGQSKLSHSFWLYLPLTGAVNSAPEKLRCSVIHVNSSRSEEADVFTCSKKHP